MNWKLFMATTRFMDEAGGEGGGGGSGGSGEGSTTTTTTSSTSSTDGKGGDEGAKPFLGGEGATGGKGGDEGAKGGDDGKGGEPPPKTFEEKDYVDGIKKDEALLGNDANVQLDSGLIKAMAPTFKELGVKPEDASKLANALAKAQVEQAKIALKGRTEYFAKMKDEALKTYTNEKDWKQINAGIDACFKKDGCMNYIVRNSELGADPEFLALMHKMGAAHMEDHGAGGASGSGATGGDPNSFAGISGLWK